MDTLIWSVTNLIAAFILPPGLFFLLLAACMIWGAKRRWLRWLAGASLAGFVLLSLNIVTQALMRPFEQRWPPFNESNVAELLKQQATIVVLGGGRVLGALEYPAGEALSEASLRRVVYGAHLATKTGLPLAVSGGKPTGGALGEAAIMKSLVEQDFKGKVAFVEDQSFDTRQNALYTAKLLGKDRPTVVLVTDVLHMPRAARAFEAAGLKVIPAPVYFQASAPLNITDFLPSMDGLQNSRYVLRELVGEVWYRFRRALPD